MSKILASFITQAEAGHIVRLPAVTEAFLSDTEAVPVLLTFTLTDGRTRQLSYKLSRPENAREKAFVREYILAVLGNALSAFGGRSLAVTVPENEPGIRALFTEAEAILRSGDGHTKPLKVIDRIARHAGYGPFEITFGEVAPEAPAQADEKGTGADLSERLRKTVARAETGVRMGIDIGGTDIKAVVYRDGKLVATKEFDWDPGRFEDAEAIIGPIVLIAKLLKSAVALDEYPHPEMNLFLTEALKKEAFREQMDLAVSLAEAVCPPEAGLADSIGISFPDVVLNDRIAGGETPKTRGIRLARPESYETEFDTLRGLNERLAVALKPGGTMHMTNDGNIAAYTAAVELAAGGNADFLKKGVLAHSLGTDFGTGWLLPDGTFPEMPLECYDLRIDLGSLPALAYPPEDLRGTRNENSGLPGARRYLGQSAAFRLLWARAPELMRDDTQGKNGYPEVRTEPEDLRKPLLAHIMALADSGNPDAEAVFRQIGENLGTISREIDTLLQPGTETRLLFGRFVKSPRCFELIREGCAVTCPGLRLIAADEELAHTALMRALTQMPGVTVAQFGQAVGAAVFGAEEEG